MHYDWSHKQSCVGVVTCCSFGLKCTVALHSWCACQFGNADCSCKPKVADPAEVLPIATGLEMIMMAAGITAIMFMMSHLLDVIFREKSSSADMQKTVRRYLGPQIADFILNREKRQAILYLAAKSLGPMKGTFVGALAQLVLKLVLCYAQERSDHPSPDPSRIVAAFSRIGHSPLCCRQQCTSGVPQRCRKF